MKLCFSTVGICSSCFSHLFLSERAPQAPGRLRGLCLAGCCSPDVLTSALGSARCPTHPRRAPPTRAEPRSREGTSLRRGRVCVECSPRAPHPFPTHFEKANKGFHH